ncbi:MAG: DUF1989 domain-containing protein [Burkholderiales bacterium]
MSEMHTIPARRGVAQRMKKGQVLKVVNTHGSQVVDFWAFNAADLGECMSMEHSRAAILRIIPKVGDTMVTNRRRPILTIVDDSSPGVHDTLIAACDVYRYQLLGCKEYHDNCTDNLGRALDAIGLKRVLTPSPFNLFMNIPVSRDNAVSFDPPVTRPGDAISFRAEMDAIVAFSACPQDMVPINGAACTPTDAHYRID